MKHDYFGYAYAASLAAGGIIGYMKAQSVPSLAAGLIFGGLLGYASYQVSLNPNNVYLQLGCSFFLTSLMGYRYLNSGKAMPGIVATVSLVNALRLSYRMANPIKEPGASH